LLELVDQATGEPADGRGPGCGDERAEQAQHHGGERGDEAMAATDERLGTV
jgi:hypothetical protein